MKFRAIINESAHMREFSSIVSTLSRMDNTLYMNIQKDKMILFINCEDFFETPIFWCEIKASNYFAEYTMQGVNRNDASEEIYLKFAGEKMAASLYFATKNCTNHIKLKLTDIMTACLLVEIASPSDDEKTDHVIVHQIPVDVVPRKDWEGLKLPTNLDYKVTLQMPDYKSFKTLIETYKQMSPKIKILLTPTGEACLVIEHIEATTNSTYRNLSVVRSSGNEDSSEGCVTIASKRIASILNGNQFYDANVFLSIHANLMLRIRFEVRNDIIINCLLPGICEDDEDD